MNRLIPVKEYIPSKSDKLFFDANIWLYLFFPTGHHTDQRLNNLVNDLFSNILKKECNIYTSSLIISEFFNSYSRIEFNIKKDELDNKHYNYKHDFRPSNEYRQISEDIKAIINNDILDISNKLDDNFAHINIENILDINSGYDFNDSYFSQLCSMDDITIVSADKDLIQLPSRKSDLIFVS